MRPDRPLELRSRLSPDRVHPFQPEDYPDLWNLTHGRNGIGGLRRARTSDVLKMFLPRSMRDNLPLKREDQPELAIPEDGVGEFAINIFSDRKFSLEFEARLESADISTPAMLDVSEYSANLPTEGGSQAFYQNLAYQLGHMGVPVIYGQKVPNSLGFFIHRVGQVPVGLLDDRFTPIKQRIQKKYLKTDADMLSSFSAFSFTTQVYGSTPAESVKPQYRAPLAELQRQFDAMSLDERLRKYPGLVSAAFHLR